MFNPFDTEKCSEPKGENRFRYVTGDEAHKILDTCPSDNWRMPFALCRWVGLRRGEALRLRWTEIDFAAHTLNVINPSPNPDTKKRDRLSVPLEPGVYDLLLAAHETAPAGSLGPCDGIGANNLDRNARVITKRAGLVYSDPFHALRKSLVSDWQAKYPPLHVARWLGHSVTVAASNYHATLPATLALVTGGETEADRLKRENEELKASLAKLQNALQKQNRPNEGPVSYIAGEEDRTPDIQLGKLTFYR